MMLVVAEQRHGALTRSSWEALAAAHALAGLPGAGGPVTVALPGAPGRLDEAAEQLASASVDEVVVVESPALDVYSADAYVAALEETFAALAPGVAVLPHSYQTRDFAPQLAVRVDRPLVTDVTSFAEIDGRPAYVRPLFQGRLAATVVIDGTAQPLVTIQAGAYRADAAPKGAQPAPVRHLAVAVDPAAIRQASEPPFRAAREAVDLTRAERIVAVGRGIREERHIELAARLADALGAELAASRPVCDSGWVAMERQIGSSGQTVSPRLYVALGVSGAIQHLVGMKGSGVVVAVNKDPDAPIFEVADYGIVGDLFEIVPELIKALES